MRDRFILDREPYRRQNEREGQTLEIAHQPCAADAKFGAQPLLERRPPCLKQAAEQRGGKPDWIHACPSRVATPASPMRRISPISDTFIAKYNRRRRARCDLTHQSARPHGKDVADKGRESQSDT